MSSEEESESESDRIEPDSGIDFNLAKSPAVQGEVQCPDYDIVNLRNGKPVSSGESGSHTYPNMNFRENVQKIPGATYATHAIHKHPAVFIPHIPRHIINTFSTEIAEDGGRPLIIDPYNGSGTAGLEAKLLGRDYVGVEINPLSKLVSDVKTSPIPPTLARRAKCHLLNNILDQITGYCPRFDVEFPDDTEKNRWFEDEAIEGLTQLRKAVDWFVDEDIQIFPLGLEQESRAIHDLDISEDELKRRLDRWFILMIANTVFEVSNADPNVSKAHRSQKMRKKIRKGEHPPDVVDVFVRNVEESLKMLIEFWNMIYRTQIPGGPDQTNIQYWEDNDKKPLADNQSHRAKIDVRLGDAREFSFDEYTEDADLGITSPPYINAMNYYRGTKLRLFWILDFLEDTMDVETLRRSIVGTNSVQLKNKMGELPKTLLGVWNGTTAEFKNTSLPALDDKILDIYNGGLSEAKSRSYITWKFFAIDMLKSLARTYEHLKPGAHFFFLIGENTIGGNKIQSHKYISDIAENIGKFEGHGGKFDKSEGFNQIGTGWDEISNRDLFQNRNHTSGVIEGEWVIVLQKPR